MRARGIEVAAAAAAVLVLVGCGTTEDRARDTGASDAAPSDTVPSDEAPRDGSGFTGEPSPLPTAPPQPDPVSDPDGAAPAAGATCQPSQLSAAAGIVDAATGYRQTGITVTNTSTLPCVLDGFPGVDATGISGSDLTLVRTDGTWNDPADGQARTVRLEPGAAAQVLVGWRGDQVGTWDGEKYLDETTAQLQLVPDGTADGPGVGVALDPAAYPLDVVDGQEVSTSSWRPAGERG
ncbi:DUF4232 domain-containing protein [Nocardioides sp. CPCC 205120]|uniref:DUF4232 domain-containing protein n=1 Tax=Nocardioides sp. CPCC 205120 TaxID=3406462 RepID=UPI003B504909